MTARVAWVGLCLVAVAGIAAAHAAARGSSGRVGSLVPLPGKRGGVRVSGESGWFRAPALCGVSSIATSADGHSVYAVANDSSSLTVFRRAARTGALRIAAAGSSCVAGTAQGGCVIGRGLRGAFDVVASRDGLNLYVAAYDAIASFVRRSGTGAVVQPSGSDGCVSATGAQGCAVGRGLQGVSSVTASPDGRYVYATASVSGSIAIFSRDPRTGVLRQLAGTDGCVNETGSEGCSSGRALAGAFSIAIAPDGRYAYVASQARDAVALFSRDPGTGTLSQLPGTDACLSEGGAYGCTTARGLLSPNSLTVSADGRNLYVAASGAGAVSAYDRDEATGALDQLSDG